MSYLSAALQVSDRLSLAREPLHLIMAKIATEYLQTPGLAECPAAVGLDNVHMVKGRLT